MIAVLALVGSSFTLLMGFLIAAVMVFVPLPAQPDMPVPPAALKGIMALSSLFYILPAIWGIASGIGLLRLRNWARVSAIVFAVLLILISAFSGLMLLVMPAFPTPSGSDAAIMASVRVAIGLFWLGLLGVGVWWLVFLNRAGVKAQFVKPASLLVSTQSPPPVPGAYAQAESALIVAVGPERPLSLTIIAWIVLLGCAFIPFSLAMRAPMFLLTKVITGWGAAAYCLVALAVQLYVGIGLLRLKPLARQVGVWYYIALMVNALVFYFVPGGKARFAAFFEAQEKMFPWMSWMRHQPGFVFDPLPFMYFGACVGIIVMAIPIYFLITRKAAFEKAAASV